ncbi:HTH-type transcriptional repressor PurR [Orchesella cincta]|uniref:HTH-type transcriptional repressor PurR n=1 Tax=Orchesella cincta TaxID=48709 RepID=A0A1D2MU40_ORCCI|nr:HTH-type transcriptional repressor PurR [Orchesella cincta]
MRHSYSIPSISQNSLNDNMSISLPVLTFIFRNISNGTYRATALIPFVSGRPSTSRTAFVTLLNPIFSRVEASKVIKSFPLMSELRSISYKQTNNKPNCSCYGIKTKPTLTVSDSPTETAH